MHIGFLRVVLFVWSEFGIAALGSQEKHPEVSISHNGMACEGEWGGASRIGTGGGGAPAEGLGGGVPETVSLINSQNKQRN